MPAAPVSSRRGLALAIGLPAVFLRGRALKDPLDADGLRRLLAADNVWGIAALLWIVTGLLRAFAGLEKGSDFYLHSPLFWTKMALFLVVLLLEIRPMITFIRWRIKLGRGETVDTGVGPALYIHNHIELAIVWVSVFVASSIAPRVGRHR